MKFSKILSTFFLLLLGCLFLASTGSAVTYDRTMSLGTANGNMGDNVTIPLSINNNTDVAGAAFTIAYDPSFLQFLGLGQTVQVIDDGNGANPNFATSMFYKVNDKMNQIGTAKIGRVMVAAASAQGFSSTTLFNARFKILAASGTSHVGLAASVIHNEDAGYKTPTAIPVLVGLPAENANAAGFYPTPTYSTGLNGGTVSVTAQGYNISGAVTYDSSTGTAANGSTVTLKKEAASGAYLFESQATVSNGTYSFNNKAAGNYRLTVQPYDTAYFIANADIPLSATSNNNDFALATSTPQSGIVHVNSAALLGVKVKVTDSTGKTLGIFPTNDQGYFETMPLPPLASGSYTYTAVYGSLEWDVTTNITGGNTDNHALTLSSISGTPIPDSTTSVPVTIQVASATARMLKTFTISTTKTAGTTYTIHNLVPANDYVVSAVTSGSPVLYYDQKTDIIDATPVPIRDANATSVDFDFSTLSKATITGLIKNGATATSGIGVIAFNTTTFATAFDFSRADGNYTISVEPGTYQLYAINNGKVFFYSTSGTTYNPLNATLVTLADGDTGGGDIDISDADTCSISGMVSYSDGAPLQGALIFAGNSATGRAATVSIQDGSYTMTGMAQGIYQVGMDPMLVNYSLQFQSVTIDETNCSTINANFVIDLGNSVSGKIREIADIGGNTIANAMLYMIDEGTGMLAGGRMYFGDDNGTYSIGDVPSAAYTMVVNHPDYNESRTTGLNIFTDTTQNITMDKGPFIHGTVKAGDGKGISGVTIVAITTGRTSVYAQTDDNGTYAVYGLLDQPYLLIASKHLFQRSFSELTTPSAAPGTTVNLTMTELPSPFTLSGRVTDSCTQSAAIANSRIIASFSPGPNKPDFVKGGITDDNGTYTISELPQHTGYAFTMVPPGNLPVQRISGIDVSTPTFTQDFTIPCPTSTNNEISGTITLQTTTGSTIYVILYDTTTNDAVDYRVLANGLTDYSFNGLDSSKTFKVLAVADGNTATWYNGQSTIDTAVGIQPGTTADITLP